MPIQITNLCSKNSKDKKYDMENKELYAPYQNQPPSTDKGCRNIKLQLGKGERTVMYGRFTNQ